MKTLYISDLDGTLLNSQAELSRYTIDALNRLIDRGLSFSVATARTAATVIQMLAEVRINIPIILMNGVCIFDIQSNRYLKTEAIPGQAKTDMLATIARYNLNGFVYAINDGKLTTYYEDSDSPSIKDFIAARVQKYGKVFTRVAGFADCQKENLVYYSVSDCREKLEMAYAELMAIPDLRVEFYRDVYKENDWFLELCAGNASKMQAVNYLREHYGFARIVGFGDNLNDLPLFAACEESYAVENARPEIKARATAVIAGNNADSVARWLENQASQASQGEL